MTGKHCGPSTPVFVNFDLTLRIRWHLLAPKLVDTVPQIGHWPIVEAVGQVSNSIIGFVEMSELAMLRRHPQLLARIVGPSRRRRGKSAATDA